MKRFLDRFTYNNCDRFCGYADDYEGHCPHSVVADWRDLVRLQLWALAIGAALLLLSCSGGSAPPARDASTPVTSLPFGPPDLCIKRRECCWYSPYDGVHCAECCD